MCYFCLLRNRPPASCAPANLHGGLGTCAAPLGNRQKQIERTLLPRQIAALSNESCFQIVGVEALVHRKCRQADLCVPHLHRVEDPAWHVVDSPVLESLQQNCRIGLVTAAAVGECNVVGWVESWGLAADHV